MRWIIIGLGIITIALAVVLARESLWWIAIPDGLFGLGVAWVSWADLHSVLPRPALASGPSPVPLAPAVELRPTPAVASPAPPPQAQPVAAPVAGSAAPPAPSGGGGPHRPAKRRGHKHRRH